MRILGSALLLVALVSCDDEERLASSPLAGAGGSAPTPADSSTAAWSPGATPAVEMIEACQGLYAAFDAWWTTCGQPALPTVTREALAARCAAGTTLPGLTVSRAMIDGCAQRFASNPCTQLPEECVESRHRWPWSHSSPRSRGPQLRAGIAEVPGAFGQVELFPTVVGTLATGQPCDENRQCASGACRTGDSSDLAAPSGPSDCGVCVDEKAPGEACGGAAVCTVGSACVSGYCQESGDPPGSACSSVKGESSCQLSSYCTGFGQGTCVRRPGLGEACGDAPGCLDDLECHAGRCEAVHPVADGDPCDIVARCPEGSVCDQAVCRPLRVDLPAGESCNWDLCKPPLTCLDGVCAPRAAVGDACQISCGYGLFCLADRCALPLAVGEACNSHWQCTPGLFCDTGVDGNRHPGQCQPLPGVGGHCDYDNPCPLSLQCTDGACRPIDACSRRR